MFDEDEENIPLEFGNANLEDEIYSTDNLRADDSGGEVVLSLRQQEEFVDDSFNDIDFSEFKGNFKNSFHKISKSVDKKNHQKKSSPNYNIKQKPLNLVVPRTGKPVLVKNVSKFILNTENKQGQQAKSMSYYKGKKLRHVTFTFNNNSPLDFNLELFNPSEPLDYLQSTSLNLNDKIQVSGGFVAYTDILYNLLANPTLMVNAQFTFSGALSNQQANQSLGFINKSFSGEQKVDPQQLALSIDPYQTFSTVVYFPIMEKLNRAFIPDGMDVMQYKILAGMTVTMTFFFKQIQLKRVLFKEARTKKIY